MIILTLDNQAYSLNNLPDEVDDDLRFALLDNSDPDNPDFFWHPLIFLESFTSPAMVLAIGSFEVVMPIDWSIAIGDGSTACDIEILPLTSLNDRGFDAVVYNPLNGFRVEFMPVKVVNFYSDFKWYFPKMRPGQLLVVPLTMTACPPCAFFVKEIPKQFEIIKLDQLT